MPRIGRYTYPAISLDEAIAFTKVLHEKCGGEARRDTFSDAIKKRGGRFNIIVGALRDWGLVRAERGRVIMTELAKRILFGITPEEREAAKCEAARKVQLFVEVTERYPEGATEEQFTLFLRDNSGAELEEIKEKSSKAYKIYSSVLKYLKPTIRPSVPTIKPEVVETVRRPSIPVEVLPEGVDMVVISREYGRWYVKDLMSVEVVLKLAEALKKKYESRKSTQE